MRYAWASMAVVLASMAWASAARAADDVPAPSPSYTKDIKPFLAAYCMRCHNERRPRAGVSVATLGDLTRTGKHGAGRPGKARRQPVDHGDDREG